MTVEFFKNSDQKKSLLTSPNKSIKMSIVIKVTFVLFIPYFHLLVYGILVTLVRDFLSSFFPSYPYCLAKCKQRLHNAFGYL